MRITYHKPAARGVNQLMYVGDDATVESATASALGTPAKIALALAAAWLLFGRK